jgi:hypothetical protein
MTYDPILRPPSSLLVTQRPLSRNSGVEHGLSLRRQNEVIFHERSGVRVTCRFHKWGWQVNWQTRSTSDSEGHKSERQGKDKFISPICLWRQQQGISGINTTNVVTISGERWSSTPSCNTPRQLAATCNSVILHFGSKYKSAFCKSGSCKIVKN